MTKLIFALLLIWKVMMFCVVATIGLVFGYLSALIAAFVWLVHSLYKIITGDLK